MRIGVSYDGVMERVGALANQVPIPVGLSMFGMPTARAMQAAQRLGIFRELSAGPASAPQLAATLGLREEGTRHLLDALCAIGTLRLASEDRYELPRRSAKWLDPSSDQYLGDFIADNHHYWEWWAGLEELVRDGRSVEMHDRPDDDPYWSSYITGQYQLARLSSEPVSKAIALPGEPRSLLDVAGGHGEYSMALCRRHESLRARIVDLPGSAAVGRDIVAGAGMSERVGYVEGDMFEADLGGPHDGALCFNIVHHLPPDAARRLFERIAASLHPGAPLCVLDLFDREPGQRPDTSSMLGLFFHLTSGADTYTAAEVSEWMAASGYEAPRRKKIIQLPGLALLRAERSGSSA
jgi:O-methyltransferase/methyltransferase family protein